MGLMRERIAVDAMGGDFAPEEIVAGSVKAATELDVNILLVGDREQIEPLLKKYDSQGTASIEVVHAEDVVTMKDEALTGIRL